ncbi:MAG TPA: hypothetical protein VHO01_00810 [Jatrophihabitans sp.]|nr:hypothetical protein [Jatrophihabitans sp.]
MPSEFVQSTLESIRTAYGQPVNNAPISVSQVSGKFADQSGDEVRPNHALAAARNVRSRETWQLGAPGGVPYEITVALSDIAKTAHKHSMITVVHRRPGTDPMVDTAWRLPHVEPEGSSPTDALLRFIEANGIPVILDSHEPTLFIVQAVAPTATLSLAETPAAGAKILASFRRDEDGNGWHYSWAYAIDTARYVASQRR